MGPGGAVWGKRTVSKKSRETVPLRYEYVLGIKVSMVYRVDRHRHFQSVCVSHRHFFKFQWPPLMDTLPTS